LEGGFWGRQVTEAGQAQLVRVPFAETTLVKALSNGERPPAALVPHLLTLADVYPTGLHAAVKAGVGPGLTTVVIGDGAVGLCAVLAARSLGAEQIIAFGGDYADRRALAQKFGATVVQPVRGAEAEAAVAEITNGVGADCVLECVGTAAAFASGLKMTRPGGTLGYVGLPHGVTVDMAELFPTNITISGGIAPARHYIPEVLPAVLKGDVTPGDVFTAALPLEQIDQAYQLMDQRSTIKVLIEPQKDNHASLS
jgi:threonine dehydrogenase-like Zn-dependent dehydrogenase